WAKVNRCPILTTNFDAVLAKAAGAKLQTLFASRVALKAPTDYYPWEKYYGVAPLNNPHDGFGIWHINGLNVHIRSIRLSLSHYMGSVSRARPWLHAGKETQLFSVHDINSWRGRNTGLHIV